MLTQKQTRKTNQKAKNKKKGIHTSTGNLGKSFAEISGFNTLGSVDLGTNTEGAPVNLLHNLVRGNPKKQSDGPKDVWHPNPAELHLPLQ